MGDDLVRTFRVFRSNIPHDNRLVIPVVAGFGKPLALANVHVFQLAADKRFVSYGSAFARHPS